MTHSADDALWHSARREGVTLFGAGRYARDVAAVLAGRGIEVHAFLTSGLPAARELDGRPLAQASAELLARSPVWIGVFNREAHSDYADIDALLVGLCPTARRVYPQAYYGGLAEVLGFRYWLQPQSVYRGAAEPIAAARAALDNEASRALFDRLLAFRCDAEAHAKPPQPNSDLHQLPAWQQDKLQVQGMAELRRHRPTLTIAVWQRADDLWRIPAFIQGLDLGYRLRLVVHGHNSFDGMLYAYQTDCAS